MINLKTRCSLLIFVFFACVNAFAQQASLYQDFKNPPLKYRPIPFWHLNGDLTTAGINKQVADARKSGFGGVAVLPVTAGEQYPTGLPAPGMTPAYLSEAYFARYADILKATKASGGRVILYDDIDYPSGTAGGMLKQKYPDLTRKVLVKTDTLIADAGPVNILLPKGALMAVVASNSLTNERKNVTSFAKSGSLTWNVPQGKWKLMIFTCQAAGGLVDYMDPEAVKKFIGLTYDEYAKRFGSYFGNVIQQTFFDDVGYVTMERGWTLAFNEKFRQWFGKDPAIYYPALWEDIGPETEAARVAFFDTRAELLAEGFPKIVSAWDARHDLKSSGHPPGNYEIQPVDMNFDIFKFYRHEDIPTMDAIFYQGHGREGFKLVSSAAAVYDRPVVASETYGAFQEKDFTAKILYATAMEIFARGINFLVPHGMWYDPKPKSVRIPPLVSPYSPKIGPELKSYNDFAARTSMMLTGGRQVAEIGIIYPIASLQGFYHFEAKDNPGVGKYTFPGTDYLALSDAFTNQLHRDFTFIHPQLFTTEKYVVSNKQVLLANKVSKQAYNVIILPAGKVISYYTLKKLKQFYDAGGKVIATTLLPSKSAEFGHDAGVLGIVKEMFTPDAALDSSVLVKTNKNGGIAMFIPKADTAHLNLALSKLATHPDVVVENNEYPNSGNGAFSYIHKIKGGKHIYYFANSTYNQVNTFVDLRGKINPQMWDPNTGAISKPKDLSFIKLRGMVYTRVKLSLPAVKSVFIVAKE